MGLSEVSGGGSSSLMGVPQPGGGTAMAQSTHGLQPDFFSSQGPEPPFSPQIPVCLHPSALFHAISSPTSQPKPRTPHP